MLANVRHSYDLGIKSRVYRTRRSQRDGYDGADLSLTTYAMTDLCTIRS